MACHGGWRIKDPKDRRGPSVCTVLGLWVPGFEGILAPFYIQIQALNSGAVSIVSPKRSLNRSEDERVSAMRTSESSL